MIALPRVGDVFIPDGDDARRRAHDELSKGEYEAAKPTWFDRMAADVVEWIASLFRGDATGTIAPVAVTIIVIVLIAALIVALVVWGRPRASRAMRRHVDLLGERDDRTAAQLRADAERRAKAADWSEAIVLRFRAIARSLLERDLIDPAPGATAQGITREAAAPFPAFADRLRDAATSFDAVRYLEAEADAEAYARMAATDDALRAASPLSAPSASQAVSA